MNRKDIFDYTDSHYGTKPEYLWASLPDAAVLRHSSNQKWYAVLMPVQGKKLGLDSEDFFDVLNVKCDEQLIGSLRETEGFFPAYHMNKEKWVSVLMNEKTDERLVLSLLEMSFSLTETKKSTKNKLDL